MIHPTAVIHPKAKLDSTVEVGPYAVIDENVELGARCRVGPHVYLTGWTSIGSDNQFFAGCVIGEAPQDLKYHGERTGLRIGDHNVFRENVTVHRSAKVDEETRMGSHCFLMANAHIGHNSRLGDGAIIANCTALGGYAAVGDKAFVSANCLIHQFTSVGTLALMRGGTAVSKDVPPYTIALGDNRISGLNIIGLRRAGMSPAERLELKRLYAMLFRRKGRLSVALTEARAHFSSLPAQTMIEFAAASKRGICADNTWRAGAAVATLPVEAE